MKTELFGKKILVVEDETDTRILLVKHLKKAGYAPIEAATGEEGLEQYRAWNPDLVLLDLILPGVDGWQILKKMKAGMKSRQVPVVVLTARDTDVDKLTGYKFGADFYLTKPWDMKNLLAVIERVLLEHGKE